MRTRRGRGIAALVALVSLVAGACTAYVEPGAAPSASPQALAPVGLVQTVAYRPFFPMTIARLMTPTAAVSSPGGMRVVERLSTSVREGGGPTELLVLRERRVDGADWLQVRLPARPNTAAGWIDADMAQLSTTPWRIVVSTERRTVDAYWNGQQVRSFSAVVGAPGSPTPHGLFAVLERVSTGSPNGFYGSWVLTLTAHSNVYRHFDGGDGRVAIHGRGGASLAVPLGSARSHGCVRLDNAAVDWLAAVAVPGTPVEID
jgi:lipoprotein-anchoring transpeptidase ErfK/SrfK